LLLLGRRRRRPGLAGAEEAAGRNRLRDRGPDPADRLHRLDRRPHDAAGRPRPALSRILTWPDKERNPMTESTTETGVVTKLSPRSVADTAAKLTGMIDAKGMRL